MDSDLYRDGIVTECHFFGDICPSAEVVTWAWKDGVGAGCADAAMLQLRWRWVLPAGIQHTATRWSGPTLRGTPPPLSRIYQNSLDHLLIRRINCGETHLARIPGPPRSVGSVASPARVPRPSPGRFTGPPGRDAIRNEPMPAARGADIRVRIQCTPIPQFRSTETFVPSKSCLAMDSN